MPGALDALIDTMDRLGQPAWCRMQCFFRSVNCRGGEIEGSDIEVHEPLVLGVAGADAFVERKGGWIPFVDGPANLRAAEPPTDIGRFLHQGAADALAARIAAHVEVDHIEDPSSIIDIVPLGVEEVSEKPSSRICHKTPESWIGAETIT